MLQNHIYNYLQLISKKKPVQNKENPTTSSHYEWGVQWEEMIHGFYRGNREVGEME